MQIRKNGRLRVAEGSDRTAQKGVLVSSWKTPIMVTSPIKGKKGYQF